jgi:hypothetical protein
MHKPELERTWGWMAVGVVLIDVTGRWGLEFIWPTPAIGFFSIS